MQGIEVEGTPSIVALRASYAAAFCESYSKKSFCRPSADQTALRSDR